MNPSAVRKIDMIWTWAARAMLLGLTILSSSLVTSWEDLRGQVEANKDAIRTLEASQFSADAGRALERRLLERMEEPPRWLTESVGRLERAAEKIDAQVESMRDRLVRLEAQLQKDK